MHSKTSEDADEALAKKIDCLQFVFPHSGPIRPPEPPSRFTTANLDLTYQQASILWPDVTKKSCANALSSKFAEGDPSKAIVLIQFYRDAVQGHVTSAFNKSNLNLPIRGAINFGAVSCYANSLLVSMFSRMENFDPLLYKQHYEDYNTELLAVWLRLFVNLLRNGELITDDIVAALLATATSAGWAGYSSNVLSQHDAAEFFVFITEKLKMPLLALKVDIAHAGKETEEFDHKLINEQLLYLSVPGNEHDPPISLEECFGIYFSNTIDVSRHLSQPNPSLNGQHFNSPYPAVENSGFRSPSQTCTTSRASKGEEVNTDLNHRRRSYSIISLTSPLNSNKFERTIIEESPNLFAVASNSTDSFQNKHPTARKASNSPTIKTSKNYYDFSHDKDELDPLDSSCSSGVTSNLSNTDIQKHSPTDYVSKETQSIRPSLGSLPSYNQLFGFSGDSKTDEQIRDIKKSLWTSNNKIVLPAWMFLQLMPFYADIQRKNDRTIESLEAEEVAIHFQRARPVLGMCLKRYFVDDNGIPHRNNRTVIIPETIYMPSFVADDSDHREAFGKFKLVLESAIIHRGSSIYSGHYCALIAESIVKNSVNRTPSEGIASSDSSFRAGVPPAVRHSTTQEAPVCSEKAMPNKNVTAFMSNASNSVDSSNYDIEIQDLKKWYLYDDMQSGGERFKEVDFHKVLHDEVPYMLFYRMVSLENKHDPSHRISVDGISQSGHSRFNSSYNANYKGAASIPSSAGNSSLLSRSPSPGSDPHKEKEKKKKLKFFKTHKENAQKARSSKDSAAKYREEKCKIM